MSIKIKRSHTGCAYRGYYIDNLGRQLTDEELNAIRKLHGVQSVHRISWEPHRIEFFIRPSFAAEVIINKVLKTVS